MDMPVEPTAQSSPGGDGVALLKSAQDIPALSVEGLQPATVVQENIIAPLRVKADLLYRTVRRRQNRVPMSAGTSIP